MGLRTKKPCYHLNSQSASQRLPYGHKVQLKVRGCKHLSMPTSKTRCVTHSNGCNRRSLPPSAIGARLGSVFRRFTLRLSSTDCFLLGGGAVTSLRHSRDTHIIRYKFLFVNTLFSLFFIKQKSAIDLFSFLC